MPRIEINGRDHQVVVDDPNGDRSEVARQARKLYEKTKPQAGPAGFVPQLTAGQLTVQAR